MIEPLFGSQIWPGLPLQASPSGWTPLALTPVRGGSGALGTSGQQGTHAAGAAPMEGYGMNSLPMTTFTGPQIPAAGLLTTPLMGGGFAAGAYLAPEIAQPVSIGALLASIAVRRGQPMGPTNDQEVEEFLYDALEWLQGAGEVDVRCEGGRVTLTGSVPNKRLKRDVGEIAWAIPAVADVQNNITIAARRRMRGAREGEAHQAAASPKKPQA